MEIPARDCATALNPSDTLSVTAFPTKMVSADKRLINSPVLVLSKNAVSCFNMELKSFSRSRVIIFCPKITVSQIIIISKFLAQDNHFQLSDWFPKPMIWAIIVKFDQIRKNWWWISCTEILEVGKIFRGVFSKEHVTIWGGFTQKNQENCLKIY